MSDSEDATLLDCIAYVVTTDSSELVNVHGLAIFTFGRTTSGNEAEVGWAFQVIRFQFAISKCQSTEIKQKPNQYH